MNWLTVTVIVVLLVIGGYFAYEQVKQKPPTWLIELFTKTDPPPPLPSGDLAPLTAPEGFTARIFARDLPGARVLIRDPQGTLLLSQTQEGNVVALPDRDGDGEADETLTILEGLQQPHGILVLCDTTCTLYVAETGKLLSYDYDPEAFTATGRTELATFPTGSGHYTRTLLPHPDGERILISIGSSCNVCNEQSPLRATVQSYSLATGELTGFSRGLRNTVFMATDPVTGKIWGTDNGRDVIGDDIPPDEINILEEGSDYGWPVCYGKNVYDNDFGADNDCADKSPSYIDLQAHSAALGLSFIPEEGWPDDWGNDLLVAFHGSWNRSEPTGYKVVRIDLGQNREMVGSPIDFLTGFLAPSASEDEAIGRPVGVLAEPGGTAYVTDDRAGAIYRITRDSAE